MTSEVEQVEVEAPKGVVQQQEKARLLVEARFPERHDSKRRVSFLFHDGAALCYRVTFLPWQFAEGGKVESAFVKVLNGVVEVAPEKPARPLCEE